MHILIVPSWYNSLFAPAKGSFFKEQAEAFAAAGYLTTVLLPTHQRNIIKRTIENFDHFFFHSDQETVNGVINLYTTHFHFKPDPEKNLRAAERNYIRTVEKYIEKNGIPDIIHAHSVFDGGIIAADLSEHFHIPFILTEHSSAFVTNKLTRGKIDLAEKILKRSSALLCVSHFLLGKMEKCMDLEPLHVSVVPNILSPFCEKKYEKKNIGGIAEEGKHFIFFNLASLIPIKRHDLLIHAFAEKFKGNDLFELQIAGTGPDLPKLKKLVSSLGIKNQVTFMGALSRVEVQKMMNRANCFVLSSDAETFGVVLIEALSQGTPVIATKCGGTEEIITEENGILVEKDHIGILADAMARMAKNIRNYDPEKIRENCLKRYGSEAFIKQMNDIFKEILSRKK